jgi:hypothetical protein
MADADMPTHWLFYQEALQVIELALIAADGYLSTLEDRNASRIVAPVL